MSKKHFIALANAIIEHNSSALTKDEPFTDSQLRTLARFCRMENNNFDGQRWYSYIAGECGPNGGKVKSEIHPANCNCATHVAERGYMI